MSTAKKCISVVWNYLIERVRGDTYLGPIESNLDHMLDYATFTGVRPVDEFWQEWVEPALANAEYHDVLFKAAVTPFFACAPASSRLERQI